MLGNLQTLTVNKDAVFDLVRLALTKPRFDADATERVRAQILAGLKFDEHDPETVASLAWDRLAFQGHPYGRPIKGTLQSIAAISRDDLKSYVDAHLRPRQAGDLGGRRHRCGNARPGARPCVRPAARAVGARRRWPTPIRRSGPTQEIIEMDVPQSVAQFGHRGIARKDADFIAAYVLNYIIGGGGFSSRLMEEVREKRGLAYSVYSNLYPYEHGAVFVGNVATKNEEVGQSLEVIESELRRACRAGTDRRGARQRQELSDRRLRAQIRIVVLDREPASRHPDRGSRHRLCQPAQQAGRGGDPRRHQACGQAPDRGRPADHHHRRQAGRGGAQPPQAQEPRTLSFPRSGNPVTTARRYCTTEPTGWPGSSRA